MWIIGFLIAFLFIVITWLSFLRIFIKKKDIFYRIEYIAYAFLSGIIIISFTLFLIGAFGGTLNILTSTIGVVVVNLFFIWIWLIQKTEQTLFKQFNFHIVWNIFIKILMWIGILWIAIKLILWWINIMSVPTYQDDAFWNWNYRAKVFYETQSIPLDKSDKDFLGGWYRQYPMTIPLSKTYFAQFYGKFDEWVVNILSFLFYISAIIILFFWILRETKSNVWAFLWVFLLTSLPLYHIHWTNPYFDLMQGLYLFVVIYSIYVYLKNPEKNNPMFHMSVIFIAFLWLTKNEWLSLYLPVTLLSIVTVLIFKKYILKHNLYLTLKDILLTSILLILPIVFFLFKKIHDLWFWNGNNSVSEYPIAYSPEAMNTIKVALFYEWNFNLFFFIIFFIIGYFLVKNIKDFKKNFSSYVMIVYFLWFWLINILLLTFVKTLHVEAISQIGVNRVYIHISLLWIFLLCILSFKILEKNELDSDSL